MKASRTKLFQNGGSQAVRLPKECRFTGRGEVLVRRQGRRVILEAADDVVEFRAHHSGGVLHERSRFEQRAGRWFYLDGEIG